MLREREGEKKKNDERERERERETQAQAVSAQVRRQREVGAKAPQLAERWQPDSSSIISSNSGSKTAIVNQSPLSLLVPL